MVNPCGSSKPFSVAEGVSHIRRRFGCDDWKSGWGKRGKGFVAAVSGARAISGYDPEMVSGAGSQAANMRTNI